MSRFFLSVHAQLFPNQGDEKPIMLPLLLCRDKSVAHMVLAHTFLDRGSTQLLSALCPAAHCLNFQAHCTCGVRHGVGTAPTFLPQLCVRCSQSLSSLCELWNHFVDIHEFLQI